MLQLQNRAAALLGALVMLSLSLVPANGYAPSSDAAPNGDSLATVTDKHGDVFKRDFADWNRESWGEPTSAKVNDQLHEGMQIGTGKDSWAEVTWPNVKTRAWANTVFAVAPNKRLVYLTGGEMLFRLDKNRKDKTQPYYIWTKVLQARIRGTTVLVQAQGAVSRITVMEGKIDVFNRLDHSWVTLEPGVAYEVNGYRIEKAPETKQPTGFNSEGALNDIAYDQKNCVRLFQDNNAGTNLYATNSQALLNHPLVTAGSTIDSLPLIQQAQASLPGFNPLLPLRLAAQDKVNQAIFDHVQIKGVPNNVDYFIGAQVGHGIALPQNIAMLPPKGQMLEPSHLNTVNVPNIAGIASPAHAVQQMWIPLPGFNPGADGVSPAAGSIRSIPNNQSADTASSSSSSDSIGH